MLEEGYGTFLRPGLRELQPEFEEPSTGTTTLMIGKQILLMGLYLPMHGLFQQLVLHQDFYFGTNYQMSLKI